MNAPIALVVLSYPIVAIVQIIKQTSMEYAVSSRIIGIVHNNIIIMLFYYLIFASLRMRKQHKGKWRM